MLKKIVGNGNLFKKRPSYTYKPMKSPKKIADSWLVLTYQSGDDKALSLLVRRWHGKLCRQALWYTKDMELAKDIVQDAWGVIIKKLSTLKDPDRFGSWALTIVTRRTLDVLKKRSKQRTHSLGEQKELPSSEVTGIMAREDDLKKVMMAIAKLPEEQRQVLTLFYLEECSLKEVATIMHVSVNTVKTRLFRAREKLKTIVKTNKYEKRIREN